MVYGLKIPGSRNLMESHGIPRKIFAYVDEVRPNDLNMLENFLRINRLRGGTAAVIVEPVGPESGTRPVARDYNQGVRRLCDMYGALLVFDEVVTGFRVALGVGSQSFVSVGGIYGDLRNRENQCLREGGKSRRSADGRSSETHRAIQPSLRCI